jgi:hypothetical protein
VEEETPPFTTVGGSHASTILAKPSISVADPDPGSGVFLTPGSGISFFPGPGSQHHTFERLVRIFWVQVFL